jgi:hypothetical protein
MPKTKKKSRIEQFINLPDAEKERIVAPFDREFLPTRPLNTEQRRSWRRFKRKMGRPKIGQGTRIISVTVEKGMLKRLDQYAKSHALSRARVIAQGVEAILAR